MTLPILDQASLWNGSAGQAWIDKQDLVDHLFRPIERLLELAAAESCASHVLDVGCGTGTTTLTAARHVAPHGSCVGVDISTPMIAVARERSKRDGSRSTFIAADAQDHPFPGGVFDLIISRFGVMFFDDPAAAFRNLRRAARDGASLHFYAWRSPGENPFMTTAERAAAPYLPGLPPRQPGAPGQFAFADPERVEAILSQGGWGSIAIELVDFPCSMPLAELEPYFTTLGPLGLVLSGADDATRVRIVETVRDAFGPFVHRNEVRFAAACWAIRARAES